MRPGSRPFPLRMRPPGAAGVSDSAGLATSVPRTRFILLVLGLLGAAYFGMEEVNTALNIVYGMLELAEALELCQRLPVALPLDLLV